MKNIALVVSGILFTIVAVVHAVRYLLRWDIIIANHTISLQVSFYGAIVAILLATWMFMAASEK